MFTALKPCFKSSFTSIMTFLIWGLGLAACSGSAQAPSRDVGLADVSQDNHSALIVEHTGNPPVWQLVSIDLAEGATVRFDVDDEPRLISLSPDGHYALFRTDEYWVADMATGEPQKVALDEEWAYLVQFLPNSWLLIQTFGENGTNIFSASPTDPQNRESLLAENVYYVFSSKPATPIAKNCLNVSTAEQTIWWIFVSKSNDNEGTIEVSFLEAPPEEKEHTILYSSNGYGLIKLLEEQARRYKEQVILPSLLEELVQKISNLEKEKELYLQPRETGEALNEEEAATVDAVLTEHNRKITLMEEALALLYTEPSTDISLIIGEELAAADADLASRRDQIIRMEENPVINMSSDIDKTMKGTLSPDGKWLLLRLKVANDPPRYTLYLVDTVNKVEAVPISENSEWDPSFFFSPDSRHVLFEGELLGQRALFLADTDLENSNRRPIVEEGVLNPCWH